MKSQPSKNARTTSIRLTSVAGAGLLLLAACSPAPADTGTEARQAPEYIATVILKDGQTAASASAALGGTVIPHAVAAGGHAALAAGSDTGVAFLAFDSMPLMSQAAGEFEVVVEPNVDRFLSSATLETMKDSTVWAEGTHGSMRVNGDSTVWAEGDSTVWAEGDSTVWAEGDSTVWAEGDSTVWAEGDSTVWAEGDFKWMPPNTALWNSIDLRDAHRQAGNFGLGVTIAVIDTGVDTQHPWLASQLDPAGLDFVDYDSDPSEEGSDSDGSYGHGTSVTGIIRQIAPRSTILPLRALSQDGSGNVIDVVRAVYYAVSQDADIINLSLGGPVDSYALTTALQYAASRGVLITSTAGNEGQQRINYPGSLAAGIGNMISVTSVGASGLKSAFANYHPGVEISAPGEVVYGPYPDNRMAAWSGTSMAAPVVAGALALALGEDVGRRGLTADLLSEAANVYFAGNSQYGNGEQLGSGIVDVAGFLDEVLR